MIFDILKYLSGVITGIVIVKGYEYYTYKEEVKEERLEYISNYESEREDKLNLIVNVIEKYFIDYDLREELKELDCARLKDFLSRRFVNGVIPHFFNQIRIMKSKELLRKELLDLSDYNIEPLYKVFNEYKQTVEKKENKE